VTKVTPLASAHGIEVIQVIPGTSPEAKATSDLIATLHNDTIPAAEHGTTLRRGAAAGCAGCAGGCTQIIRS
jgi:hypothetical protein